MTSRYSDPGALNDVSELRHRRSLPDVPTDVDDDELLLHLNDPNYDLDGTSASDTYYDASSEPSEKGRYPAPSSGYIDGTTDIDAESQVSSSWRGSKPELQKEEYNDDSPYAEVRAAVSNTDDPAIPVNTFRAWFIGVFIVVVVSGYNAFITLRMPGTFINALLIQIIALPFGKLLEKILPAYRITVLGYSMSLNPGPFNIKEHTLITMMGNVVINASNFSDVVAVEMVFFNNVWGYGKQILLSLSVQLFGFGAAGFFRQFLVWPSSMIWPGVLVRAALLSTMHKNYGKKETKHISRERFFLYAMICSFVWYWVPGFLWTGLSVFNWVCWIAPNNIVVNTLFGTNTGLGMGLLTFDWSMISWIASPLVVPWWAQLNIMAAFIIVVWFVAPIMWAKNVFFSQFMPIMSTGTFDNTGLPYNASAILTDNVFDEDKYIQYSPVYMPITAALTWGMAFALYGAVIVHTFLWYRKDIVRQFSSSMRLQRDVHSRLMGAYPEVPRWWYGAIAVVAFVFGIIGNEVADTGLPIWAYVVGVLVGIVFILPLGILQAITNQPLGVSVLAEMMGGYMIPGRPVANMVFKTMTYSTTYQALSFASDMKMGHYMKVPPQMMFMGQVLAAIIGVFSASGMQTWALHNIEDVCAPDQKDFFTCPDLSVFDSSALLWGNIGPKRVFGPGSTYYPIMWFFLIGAFLPIPFYFLARRYPRSMWRYVHVPVAVGTLVIVPPATGIQFSSFFIVGLIFQWYIRRFHFRWWMRYNYLLSSGLDAGVIIGLFVIFLVIQLPKGGIELNWWGKEVWLNTADAMGLPLKVPAPGDIFGPTQWS
ncbi:OPT oligopeptide transporter [Amylostereum chailletii]|nr:OPT oligopeptide transporter [Amylostereum chailletii]